MKIIQPSVEVWPFEPEKMLKNIELAGRVCYKSEDKITEDSYIKMVSQLIAKGHHSVLEHEKLTVKFIVDRGVSHEIVRRRIAAYSQESTRYCNYGKQGEVTFIKPFFFVENDDNGLYAEWKLTCYTMEACYLNLLHYGASPQEARSVLPNSLKTEIVVTYNLREWRHFFTLRCARTAHPQMKQVAIPLMKYFQSKIPLIFDHIHYDVDFVHEDYAEIKEV